MLIFGIVMIIVWVISTFMLLFIYADGGVYNDKDREWLYIYTPMLKTLKKCTSMNAIGLYFLTGLIYFIAPAKILIEFFYWLFHVDLTTIKDKVVPPPKDIEPTFAQYFAYIKAEKDTKILIDYSHEELIKYYLELKDSLNR